MLRQTALCLLSLTAFAQMIGEVSGYVKGPDGRPVANAVIGFDRQDYKLHREAKSDKKGAYEIHTLLPGDYSVTVTVDGKLRASRDASHAEPGRPHVWLTFILTADG